MPLQACPGAPILAGTGFCCAPGAHACRGPCTQAGLRVHVECTLCWEVFQRVGGVGLQSGTGGLVFERAVLGAASEFCEAIFVGVWLRSSGAASASACLGDALRCLRHCLAPTCIPDRVSAAVGGALPLSGVVQAPA